MVLGNANERKFGRKAHESSSRVASSFSVVEPAFENATIAQDRQIQPPELVRNMSSVQLAIAEAALRKKIDLRLLPMAILMYIMNYLDRSNIAAARLAGLEKDLNLSSVEYSTSVSILFVGYILMQVPSNLFLNKIGKPALYLPSCMIVWGAISAATAGCQTYGGLVVCRFMLGFVEAAYFPGCVYYLSCWYTRTELSLRIALLFSGSLISGAFSGLLSAGIASNMDGARGLAAWRWLFIIEGSATVAIASAAFFVLPDFPRTTKWLSAQERQLASWRLEDDIGIDDWIDSEHQSFGHGLKLAFADTKTYILMIMLFGISASASGTPSVINFFPTVVATLNYGSTISLLLTTPPYVLAIGAAYLNAWHTDRSGERYFHLTIPLWASMACFILAATTTATALRYAAMMLMLPSIFASFVIALPWVSNTLPRPPAKRAAAIAATNAIGLSSNIYTSYMYATGAPRYAAAMGANCATAFLAICMATLLRRVLVGLNRKLDLGVPIDETTDEGIPVEAARRGFRYKV